MAQNPRTTDIGSPVWYDGKSINEALFCEEFLREHKIIFAGSDLSRINLSPIEQVD